MPTLASRSCGRERLGARDVRVLRRRATTMLRQARGWRSAALPAHLSLVQKAPHVEYSRALERPRHRARPHLATIRMSAA